MMEKKQLTCTYTKIAVTMSMSIYTVSALSFLMTYKYLQFNWFRKVNCTFLWAHCKFWHSNLDLHTVTTGQCFGLLTLLGKSI